MAEHYWLAVSYHRPTEFGPCCGRWSWYCLLQLATCGSSSVGMVIYMQCTFALSLKYMEWKGGLNLAVLDYGFGLVGLEWVVSASVRYETKKLRLTSLPIWTSQVVEHAPFLDPVVYCKQDESLRPLVVKPTFGSWSPAQQKMNQVWSLAVNF